jgi:hypothetical protein
MIRQIARNEKGAAMGIAAPFSIQREASAYAAPRDFSKRLRSFESR